MYVYADHAATTELSTAARKAMLKAMKIYGNPSSLHTPGQRARVALEDARDKIASCLGADPKEIYFTSGGSEADNQVIRSLARLGAKNGKLHLISTRFEHHAVLRTLEQLERDGFEVTLLDIPANGIVQPEQIAAAIRPDTALVSVMYANNEIGTVQPVREIGAICRQAKVPFHTDAVQAVGHVPVNVRENCIDALSLSAHKFHGPKGIGVLYVRRGIPLSSFIVGGAQERGKRAGTENLPAIVGMSAALSEATTHLHDSMAAVAAMRNSLIEGLSRIPYSHLNGDRNRRLPGTVNFCFEGIEGESLLLLLDRAGIAASSGSACTSGSLEPSHVLLALGLPHEVAHGSLRLSLDVSNQPEQIAHILKTVPKTVQYLREMSPVWEDLENGKRSHFFPEFQSIEQEDFSCCTASR